MATPAPENTFVTFLIAGGMERPTAQRLSDFFEYDDWKQLCVFTDKAIADIRAGELGDASGDLVLSEEDLGHLRFTAEFCRQHRSM